MKKYILKSLMVFLLIIEFYPLEADSQTIAEDRSINITQGSKDTGSSFELFDAAPAELNGVTSIKFNIFKEGPVNLNIYDAEGKKITTLAEGFMEQGHYNIFFKAFKDIAPGVYFYKLEVNGSEQVKSMMLTR